ncbi:hypothetical protein PNOK_0967300 [Pyrrhoderma noxium]|uniref:Uncharacterized protein n=1 Tax=Pyrrhoderma noxium TaxID=2282107 RepID=A0A286U4T8_9AGAM|nr:hypothetical protein PNOK_0967300 [Pyrrhoderma noxium]
MASKLKTLATIAKVVTNPTFWRYLRETIRNLESLKLPTTNGTQKDNIPQSDADIIKFLFPKYHVDIEPNIVPSFAQKVSSKNESSNSSQTGVHVYLICNANRKQASQIESEYAKRGKYTGKGSLPSLVKKMAPLIDPYPKKDSSQSSSNSPPVLLLQPPQPSSLSNVTTSSTGSRNSIDMEAVQRHLDERIRNLPRNNKHFESFYVITIGRRPGIYISSKDFIKNIDGVTGGEGKWFEANSRAAAEERLPTLPKALFYPQFQVLPTKSSNRIHHGRSRWRPPSTDISLRRLTLSTTMAKATVNPIFRKSLRETIRILASQKYPPNKVTQKDADIIKLYFEHNNMDVGPNSIPSFAQQLATENELLKRPKSKAHEYPVCDATREQAAKLSSFFAKRKRFTGKGSLPSLVMKVAWTNHPLPPSPKKGSSTKAG